MGVGKGMRRIMVSIFVMAALLYYGPNPKGDLWLSTIYSAGIFTFSWLLVTLIYRSIKKEIEETAK